MDEEIKLLLKPVAAGRHLSVDLIAHIDYFYNTLDCDFHTPNPLYLSNQFKAPSFVSKGEDKRTLLGKYRDVLYPCLSSRQSTDESDLPKKYGWYPNTQLGSPMKSAREAASPVPKSISSYFRHQSVKVRNDPMTPQSQVTRGGLTKRADANKTESFGQVVSAVKQQAQKRVTSEIGDGSLLGQPTPKMLTGCGKKSVLLDDEDFEEMQAFL